MGALVNKSYIFVGRPWELNCYNTINVVDGILLNNLRVNVRGGSVIKITGCNDWISDKVRYLYDSLLNNRLLLPYSVDKGMVLNVSWEKLFLILFFNLEKFKKKINFLYGNLLDLESIFFSKFLMVNFGAFFSKIMKGNIMNKFNLNINDSYELIFIGGINLRKELPLIYNKFKKPTKYTFGIQSNNNKGKDLGNNINDFLNVLEGKYRENIIFFFKKKMLFLLNSRLSLKEIFLKRFNIVMKDVCLYSNEMHKVELFLNNNLWGLDGNLVYSMGADIDEKIGLKKDFLVYQGHHVIDKVKYLNVLIPSVTFFEKSGFYMNFKCEMKSSTCVLKCEKEIKDDWSILNALYEYIDVYSKEIFLDKKSLFKKIKANFFVGSELILRLYVKATEFFLIKIDVVDGVECFYNMDNLSIFSKLVNTKKRLLFYKLY